MSSKNHLAMPFMEWPEVERFSVRNMIEWTGGKVSGYTANGVTVIMPVEGFTVLRKAMLRAGLGSPSGHMYGSATGGEPKTAVTPTGNVRVQTFVPRGLI
jgi:hypothetical protein